MATKRMITSDEAVPAQVQHTQPCIDCPFLRDSIAGWIGAGTVEEWIKEVHGEAVMECHVLEGAQCAGSSIYRANMSKMCRNPDVLRLPADRQRVFATPMEFTEHHTRG